MRLKGLREQRGMSQRELAAELGVSAGAIGNYESGQRRPDYETLRRIAELFRTSVDYLLGSTDDPRPVDEIVAERARRAGIRPPKPGTKAYELLATVDELYMSGPLDEEWAAFVLEFIRRTRPRGEGSGQSGTMGGRSGQHD
ncbi:MAG: helix-turn-helix transcriptional regulator [Sphaerobacter sp.]|nr:helix-turn-helix transcriptional regulator [Sphaerobacter sp.]